MLYILDALFCWDFSAYLSCFVCLLFLLCFTVVWEAMANSGNFMFNGIKNNLMQINNIMSTKFCSKYSSYNFLLMLSCCKSFFYFTKANGKFLQLISEKRNEKLFTKLCNFLKHSKYKLVKNSRIKLILHKIISKLDNICQTKKTTEDGEKKME